MALGLRRARIVVWVGTQLVAGVAAADGASMLHREVRITMAEHVLVWFERHVAEVWERTEGGAGPGRLEAQSHAVESRALNRDVVAHAVAWLELGAEIAAFNDRLARQHRRAAEAEVRLRETALDVLRGLEQAAEEITAHRDRYTARGEGARAAREAAGAEVVEIERLNTADEAWSERSASRLPRHRATLERLREEARVAHAAQREAMEALRGALDRRAARFGSSPARLVDALSRWLESGDPSIWLDVRGRPTIDPAATEVARWYRALDEGSRHRESRDELERERLDLIGAREALVRAREVLDGRRMRLGDARARERARQRERIETRLAALDRERAGSPDRPGDALGRLLGARAHLTALEVQGWLAALDGDGLDAVAFATAARAWSDSAPRAAAAAGVDLPPSWRPPDALTARLVGREDLVHSTSGEVAPALLARWFDAMLARGEFDRTLGHLTSLTARARPQVTRSVRTLFTDALHRHVSAVPVTDEHGPGHIVGLGARAYRVDHEWHPVASGAAHRPRESLPSR